MSTSLHETNPDIEVQASYVDTEKLPWIDWAEGHQIKIARLNPSTGQIVFFIKSRPGAFLPIHFHPGTVIVYTIQGNWTYDDGWNAKPGDVAYETAGSTHRPRMLPGEDVIIFAVVEGALVFLDDEGNVTEIENWQSLLKKYRDHCVKHEIKQECITF
ncbi:2,4'-dihydroxyacetophenone dioxygenase family protein [Trinickia mobilis]|uniref:2,4'-dihydroxyacetophenone dioxygenase family protein n=1 Tax=Trinickia mobilis TaxID=2816356 RepID=UPI001A8C54EC|nr:2,4'-dihydroxyacetophenone dioxygenase family protein [Trinickia mobilis]